MHFYSTLIFLISLTLATPLFTSRWQQAYKCELNSIKPRCCVYGCKIVSWLDNTVCIVEDKSHGQPHRVSILIDEFPVCTVFRSGPCIYDSELCVRIQKHVFICQTSFSITFKHQAVEWCFTAHLKMFGVKMYKYSRLCACFAENYFVFPRKIEDLLIDLGY